MGKLRKLYRRLFYGTAFLFCLNNAAIPAAWFVNRNIDTQNNTVVFTCGKTILREYGIPEIPSSVLTPFVDYVMYPPIVIKQNLRGNRVYWFSNPDLEKFIDEIENPYYDNIILIGHGSKSTFSLQDVDVNTYHLKMLSLLRRDGEFYQYTCGEKYIGPNLEDALFSNSSRSISFNGVISPLTIYASAWMN